MKVKASTVRRIIRESIRETFEWTPEMKAKWKESLDVDRHNAELVHGVGRMNPDVVYDELNRLNTADPEDRTYLESILLAVVEYENYPAASYEIISGLQALVDQGGSVPRAWIQELQDMLRDVSNEDDLVGVVAEWIPRHWRVSDSGKIMGKKEVFQQ